jgi:hypothetical protein
MYKVVAERIDPSGLVYRMEGNWRATSFDCIIPKDDTASHVKLWLDDGQTTMVLVSGKDADFQCVIIYGASDEVVQYMKTVKGVVSKHLGPTVDRSSQR